MSSCLLIFKLLFKTVIFLFHQNSIFLLPTSSCENIDTVSVLLSSLFPQLLLNYYFYNATFTILTFGSTMVISPLRIRPLISQ